MKQMHRLGFFRELRYGDPAGPELMSSLNAEPQIDEDKIVTYLRSGVMMIFCPGIAEDVLSKSREHIGSPSILTDGNWAWPADLAHYVGKYHVSLPEDFIKHVRERHFVMPHEDEPNLTELDV